jgi:hypothetical protein
MPQKQRRDQSDGDQSDGRCLTSYQQQQQQQQQIFHLKTGSAE